MTSLAARDPAAADGLARRGVLALFIALALALGVGLLAAGPVTSGLPTEQVPETLAALGCRDALLLLSSVGMVLAGVRGWRVLRADASAPSAVRRAWGWLFVTVVALGLVSGLRHALGVAGTRALIEFCCALSSSLLFIAWMADRVHPGFGSAAVRVTALALSAAAAAWWGWSFASTGAGDLRGVLFIEALPWLALAGGLAGLACGSARVGDSLALLAALAAARLMFLADGNLFADLGPIVYDASALGTIAAGAAWFAHRLAALPVMASQAAGLGAKARPAIAAPR